MLPTNICRTCAQQTDNLLALSTCTETYVNKSISEMLHELTHNDPMELAVDDLPQYLCADCLPKLQNAYGFVLQARQVQEQLLLELRKDLLAPQCLDETPIDMALQSIKTEVDIPFDEEDTEIAGPMDTQSLVCVAALKLQPESDSESNQGDADADDDEDLQPMQRRHSGRKPKLSIDSGDEAASGNLKPIKRRRGRPARVTRDQTTPKEGRFPCEVCGKTFLWHRDMQRHARIHYEEPSYVCEQCGKGYLRKDKYICHLRMHEKHRAKSESNQGDADADDDEDLQPMQRRHSGRKPKLSIDSGDEAASADLKPIVIKRRRGRPARVTRDQTTPKEGRFPCEVCGKTFLWHRDMQRHARIHFEEPSYVCEECGKGYLRKDKYICHLRMHENRRAKSEALPLSLEWRFAERLYSSGRLKCVECKLCGLRCQRILELREHLSGHIKAETLSDLSADSDVIREQFPDHQDLAQIRQMICADIAKGREHLDKYCSVVNAYGYELCLSDSDEEITGITPYECLPCNASFTRKHRLMRHTLETHTQSTDEGAWLRCNGCQIGFVCSKMLEQHQTSQCYSEFKQYSCAKCPGKFIWEQNLRQHACCEGKKIRRQFNCCLCDEQLESMATLRSHLLTHRDGRTGIDPKQSSTFLRCFYPDGLDCNWTELSGNIANDFEAGDYGRYFNACTTAGQELDFLDSDTELSDSETTSPLAVYTCDLCGETATRLSHLRRHQEDEHSDLKALPHVCDTCGMGFVADAILQWHRRTVCCKRHANYHCMDCNLHFVWLSNHERHMKLAHGKAIDDGKAKELERQKERSRRQRESSLKLQCDECDKVFIWPKDLTRHKRIHQNTEKYDCSYCERKFLRKDNLKSHLRVHGEQQQPQETASRTNSDPDIVVMQDMPAVWSQLCRPNGCKQIKCMICSSYHTKISDLRTHLISHQFAMQFVDDHPNSELLYPELRSGDMDSEQLIERIQFDLARGDELERFVSITNEAGIELSLDSSETDTDSDSAETTGSQVYDCDLCQLKVSRKHLLYAHQLEQHAWQEASHVCCHCQARFVSEQLLDHHYRSLCGNPLKRFLCRKCPLRFRWRDNLKLHADVAHAEVVAEELPSGGIQLNGTSLLPVVSYDCHECKRSFKMQKDLTRHKLMHAQESSIYRCRWCSRRFYREANHLQHIERHGITAAQLPYAEALLNASGQPNGTKCIQCKVCNVQFPTIAALRSHLLSVPSGTHHEIGSMLNYSITNKLGYELHLEDSETDEEAKPPDTPAHYTCGMCQLRCVRKYELHQHQQAMHRLERIKEGCDECIFKSVSPDLIAYHKRVQCGNLEKQFKCTTCGYKFMWESNLLLHMQREHTTGNVQGKDGETVADPVESTSCQIFKCAQCPRKYNRKDRLSAHMKKCHGPGAIGSATKKPKASSSGAKQQNSFLCAFCGKAVSSSSNLIVHIRRHTGEKPFKCDFCDKAFPRSSDLQCHRRTHTGERPHVCTVCKKGFARSYKLQQHMRIHNGERPYKCTYCDKSFTQSNDLTLHIRRHTGERPYQCNTCGERFIQGTALKNHRQQSGHSEDTDEQAKNN